MESLESLLKSVDTLPLPWKIFFLVTIFILPRFVNFLGGGEVVRKVANRIGIWVSHVVKNYQARQEMELEDLSLTRAYSRTMIIESLKLFATRLDILDHKLNYVLFLLEPDLDVKEIEKHVPTRNWVSEDIIITRLKALHEMDKPNLIGEEGGGE